MELVLDLLWNLSLFQDFRDDPFGFCLSVPFYFCLSVPFVSCLSLPFDFCLSVPFDPLWDALISNSASVCAGLKAARHLSCWSRLWLWKGEIGADWGIELISSVRRVGCHVLIWERCQLWIISKASKDELQTRIWAKKGPPNHAKSSV